MGLNFQYGGTAVLVKPHTNAMSLPTIPGGAGDNHQDDRISSMRFQ